MQAEKLAKYLTNLKNKTELSFEAIGKLCDKPESTIKNLCNGKTDNPGIDTVAPVIYALGGSLDEMYNPEKTKDEVKETSVLALKELYEFQNAAMKETCEAHITNIRSHYEQHREDVTTNYEMRLSDKREIIDMQNAHIAKLEETSKSKTKIILALSAILFVLFFGLIALEVLHPEHGWIRF